MSFKIPNSKVVLQFPSYPRDGSFIDHTIGELLTSVMLGATCYFPTQLISEWPCIALSVSLMRSMVHKCYIQGKHQITPFSHVTMSSPFA